MPTYVSILRIPQMIWVWRATVEWYWQGKPNNSEKNLSQCHSVHYKSHMDWPGRETGPPRWEAGDLSHGTARTRRLHEANTTHWTTGGHSDINFEVTLIASQTKNSQNIWSKWSLSLATTPNTLPTDEVQTETTYKVAAQIKRVMSGSISGDLTLWLI
jgi:hypothetical protein